MTDATESQPLDSGTATRLFPQGKLKIFLGASPGVGKTFAMLQAGAERLRENVDVVVGLAETHKRKETEDQLVNLEALPRKVIVYRGRTFEELDLDGILSRAPQLVLIDECAHSNLPGSRHPKRYNDIEEILKYGIDVYTTLNIQHIESLKDVVEQMTHITVRESVPDSFFKSANEVQLIDLPPDDLLQRLADGKVYVPDQAKEAIENFFRRSNLLSLRELALRHAITVADDEMSDYNKEHGIKGSWPASDKVMVCIGTDDSGGHLVRTACIIANRMQATWIVVHVETPQDEEKPLVHQKQLTKTLRLAEELKAREIVTLDGVNIADTLVHYAMSQNVTDLVVGQSQMKTIRDKIPLIRRKSVVMQILSYSPPLTIRIIPPETKEQKDIPVPQSLSFQKHILPYLLSFSITLGTFVAAKQASPYLFINDISPLLFLSILFVSIRFGLMPALAATTIISLVYGYYYIDPKYHWGIQNLEGWISFLSFFTVAFITSIFGICTKDSFSVSQGRLRLIHFLSAFSRDLMHCSNKDQVLDHLCRQLHNFIKVSAVGLWDDLTDFRPIVDYSDLKPVLLKEIDANAIQWALAHQSRSGRSTETFSDASYLYLPIKVGNNSLGVVGIWPLKDSLTIDEFRIAQILVNQAAFAIERLNDMGAKK